MKQFCRKHATWVGCAVAAITFVALHVIVPAFVAGTVAHSAHAKTEPVEQFLLQYDGVQVILLDIGSGFSSKQCVVAIAEGRMAKTVDIECF